MSESQLTLQLRGVPSPCAAGLLQLPLHTRLPPGQPSMPLVSFAKAQHLPQLLIQFPPFSAVMFDYFCPALVPIELSFFQTFFFKFSKIYLYFTLVAKVLAAPLISVASANLAGIVSLDGIRSEILYIKIFETGSEPDIQFVQLSTIQEALAEVSLLIACISIKEYSNCSLTQSYC